MTARTDPVKGELKTSSEKQKTDQLRERRKKKLKQRARHKEQEQKEKAADQTDPGQATGKHAKKRALRQLEKAHKDGTVTLVMGLIIFHLHIWGMRFFSFLFKLALIKFISKC